jgi:DNA-binding XRE family transcriptional regulator
MSKVGTALVRVRQPERLASWPHVNGLSPVTCRAMRAWLGWTQADLAALAKCTISVISGLEHGDHNPRPAHAKAILAVFDAFGGEIIMRDGKPVGIMFFP